ncbi:MAG: hypothetical protein JWN43_2126, partial [Gammaproteobacteria bacterium]|nr:hypothetical protein [Gammaproteobacteria bacterium]
MPPKPQIESDFQYGSARSGSIAFAVDDAYAPPARITAVREEVREPIARGALAEPVKVQFVLDGYESSAQAPYDLGADAGALERQRIASGNGALCNGAAGLDEGRVDQRHRLLETLRGRALCDARLRSR